MFVHECLLYNYVKSFVSTHWNIFHNKKTFFIDIRFIVFFILVHKNIFSMKIQIVFFKNNIQNSIKNCEIHQFWFYEFEYFDEHLTCKLHDNSTSRLIFQYFVFRLYCTSDVWIFFEFSKVGLSEEKAFYKSYLIVTFCYRPLKGFMMRVVAGNETWLYLQSNSKCKCSKSILQF